MNFECCSEKMNNLGMWNSQEVGYAFNVYLCGNCGKLIKEDVWKNPSYLEIFIDGTIRKFKAEVQE